MGSQNAVSSSGLNACPDASPDVSECVPSTSWLPPYQTFMMLPS